MISLGKEELNLEPHGPVRCEFRLCHIVESLQLNIQRQFPYVNNLPHASSERHGPLVAAARFPVGCDNGRGRQIPAVRKVVVDEVLEKELVHIGPIVIACVRPEVVGKRPDDPMPCHDQSDRRGPGTPLTRAENVVCGRRELQDRAHPPDEFAGFSGRKKERCIDIPEAECASCPMVISG